MAYAIRDGYLIHIPGGMIFKTIKELWEYVDKEIAKHRKE